MSAPTYMSGMLFTKAHRVVRERIYELLGMYQLTPTLWSLLSIVMRTPDGIRSSVVATELSVKPPMVTMMADDLISLGLLRRVPHHTDGRVKILLPTAKGRTTAKEVENKLSGEIGYLMSGVSHSEIVTFQKVLQSIILKSDEV